MHIEYCSTFCPNSSEIVLDITFGTSIDLLLSMGGTSAIYFRDERWLLPKGKAQGQKYTHHTFEIHITLILGLIERLSYSRKFLYIQCCIHVNKFHYSV